MRILYFSWAKEKIGLGEEVVSPPPEVATVGQLLAWLATRSPGHDAALGQPGLIRAAVNQDHVPFTHPVNPDDEIAFFPPVTGGQT